MIWRMEDPQGNEAGKVKYDIVQYTRGAVLDLGCGPNKAFPHFVGVDNCADTELFGVQMRPDIRVEDCSDLSQFEDGKCDAVFSSHLLEHIVDTEKALREWWRVIKVGGYLVLYLPHKDLYPNVGTEGANPDHKHDFTPNDIWKVMRDIAPSYNLVVDEVRDGGTEYSFLQVYQKTDNGGWEHSYAHPKPEKTACVVRYGGFGDMLQASNILPQLKREGYHVTFMTTPKGQEILREDPHIDSWFIQDDDQVPNHELAYFWSVQCKRFDKFVQLSESVEGTLLALPGRANHAWPQAVRRVELNKNYLEWTSALAELEYHSDAKFYPTYEERAKVEQYLANVQQGLWAAPDAEKLLSVATPPRFFVLWALAGSSVHKFYPWQDSVIARILLDIPEVVFILTGDHACQILEQGWENETRVRCESGNIDIRSTLTLAQHVDCVVGPETGVLNAVAFEPVPKVIMLSHSSKENLTKHWNKVITLTPENTPCYPCHRLHYGRDFCPEHVETGAAMCQIDIAPDLVVSGIKRAYEEWKK